MKELPAIFSAIAAVAAVAVAIITFVGQRRLMQRGNIVPIWTHLAGLRDINPAAPIGPDVISAVNTLELVALCCEYGVLDRRIVMRTFRDGYIRHFESIRECTKVPGKNRSGVKLLEENRAASTLYLQLKQESLERDKP